MNGQRAESSGVEIAGTFQAAEWWRLRAGYTYLTKDVWATIDGVVPTDDKLEGLDPHNQFSFHSMLDLPENY